MTEARVVNVRIAVTDVDKAVAELKRLGVDGDAAMKRLAAAKDRAAKSGGDLAKELTGLRGVLDKIGTTLNIVDGPLGGVASRFNTFNAAITRTGLLTASFVGGVAVATTAITLLARAGASAETQLLSINAVLDATGRSAGRTSSELERQADSIAKSTLASVEGVREAQKRLLTFRTVQGEIFDEALVLSQDLAAVFGGDVATQAQRLAKSLNDPVRGLEALREAGIQFTKEQENVIRALAETGRVADAQRLILEEVRNEVGGAGARAAGGLAGAADYLAQQWGELLSELGRTAQVQGPVVDALNAIGGALERLRRDRALATGEASPLVTADEQLAALEKRLAEVQRQRRLPLSLLIDVANTSATGEGLAEEERRLVARIDEIRERARREDAEKDLAFKGAREQRQQELEAALSRITAAGEEQRLKLRENAIEKIRGDEARDIEALSNLRRPKLLNGEDAPGGVGIDDARIEAAIAQRKALADALIAALPPIRATVSETQKLAEADAKLIDELEFELKLIGLSNEDRAREISLRKLSAIATDEQRAKVAGLADAIETAKNQQKDEEFIDALREEFDLVGLTNEAREIEIALRKLSADATAEQRAETEDLIRATQEQREAQEEANRRLGEAREFARGYARDLTDALRALSKGDFQGIDDAINGLLDRAQEQFIFKPIEDAIFKILDPAGGRKEPAPVYIVAGPNGGVLDLVGALADAAPSGGGGGLEGAISGAIGALAGGGASKAGEDIGADIGKGVADGVKAQQGGIVGAFQNVIGAVAGLVGGGGGGAGGGFGGFGLAGLFGGFLLSKIFGGGGKKKDDGPQDVFVVGIATDAFAAFAGRATAAGAVEYSGAGSPSGYVNPTIPRFHNGGVVGLGPNEMPAIVVERGERILSRRETAEYEARGGGRNAAPIVNVTMDVRADDARGFVDAQEHIADNMARLVMSRIQSGRV